MPKELSITAEHRLELGKAYQRRLEDAEFSRTQRMHGVYVKANKYYEGKARRKTWPWPGASDAILPIIATHCDVLKARLHAAATVQKPTYLLDSILPEDIELMPGVTAGRLRDIWQQWSDHVTEHVWQHEEVMDIVTSLMVKYGDAIVYQPWKNWPYRDYIWDDAMQDWVMEERDLYDRPVPYVIHPKNTYISTEDWDLQKTKYFGFDEYWDPSDIKLMGQRGEWNIEAVNAVLDYEKQNIKNKEKEEGTYYKTREDGSVTPRDVVDESIKREAGLEVRDHLKTVIRLVRVFAREDINKDGYEEEIEMLVHRESATVVYVTYRGMWHGERPLVHFAYQRRDGVFYSIGAAEMLFNIQKIMNQLIRDQLDNNKIQNTKIFVYRAGGPIEDGMRIYPGRMVPVDDIKADFDVMDAGSGRPVDVINTLPLIQDWGERRTGVNDAAMGKMSPKRAPATSTLAMLEQSNKGTDHIIRRMGRAQKQMWKQCMALYVQFGQDMESMAKVLGPENAQILRMAWDTLGPKDVREVLTISAQVSTSNLNQQTKRQESTALFGMVQQAYQAITQTAFMMAQVQDPALRQLLVYQLQGFNKALGRIFDTFEVKDQKFINPNFLEILQNVPPQPTPEVPGGGGPGGPTSSDEMGQVIGLFGGNNPSAGPINPVGRPTPGAPRNPGETNASIE
jgi:hypothetical protein